MKFKTYEKIIPGDLETPITLYLKYVQDEVGFLLESREQPKGRYSFLGKEGALRIQAKRDEVTIKNGTVKEYKAKPLQVVEENMNGYEVENTTKLPFVGGAVGTVGYDMIKQYEVLPDDNTDDIDVPDLDLMFITEYIAYDHHFTQIHLVVLEEDTVTGKERANQKLSEMGEAISKPFTQKEEPLPTDLTFTSNISEEQFIENVHKAKQYITDGDIFQVVLSQRFQAKYTADSFNLYRKLRSVNPSPYLFYFNYGTYQIVGSSPEMLVELKSDRLKTCPIAGTRKRGANFEEDEALKQDLLKDEKERAEHNMLVDLGRNDMGKVSKFGSVEVTEYMQVHYYSHVMHLVSLVEGEIHPETSMFDALMSFLPAGTLSGAPKIRAMEIIDELETTRRGIYGGAIGYFGFNGNMDMCIAIRTMVLKDEQVYIQAGAGIVADSKPDMEYQETYHKAKALMKAIQG